MSKSLSARYYNLLINNREDFFSKLIISALSKRLIECFEQGDNQAYTRSSLLVASVVHKLVTRNGASVDSGNEFIRHLCEPLGLSFPKYLYDNKTDTYVHYHEDSPRQRYVHRYISSLINEDTLDAYYFEDDVDQEFSQCSDCGQWEVRENLRTPYDSSSDVCRTCISDNYQYSGYYDEYVHDDDAVNAIDEHGNEHTVSSGDRSFNYDEDRDCYVHDEYDPKPEVFGGYHSSKKFFKPIPSDWTVRNKRYFGVELEVEVAKGERREKVLALNEIINGGDIGSKVFFETDGSLTHGFEIITQPMGLDNHTNLWKWLKTEAKDGLLSHKTSTCGLHVHVSRALLTPLQISKLVFFINDPSNQALIEAVARRYNTRYANFKDKKLGSAYKADRHDRYQAINIENRETIEFRIFKGTLKYESIMAAIEFTNALVNFCNDTSGSGFQLTTQAFLRFIETPKLRAETRFVRAYLQQRLDDEGDSQLAA
jgi:hypothetical protein